MKFLKAQKSKMLTLLIAVSIFMIFCGISTAQASEGKKLSNSTLPEGMPYTWEAKLDGNTITIDLVMKELAQKDGSSAGKAVLYVTEGIGYESVCEQKLDSSGACRLSADLTGVIAGTTEKLSVNIAVYKNGVYDGYLGNAMWSDIIYLERNEGQAAFRFVRKEAFDHVQDAVDQLAFYNTSVKPENNLSYSTYGNLMYVNHYDEIYATTQELIKDCTTEMEKIVAIHDWICQNFAYDYEALKTSDGMYNANQIDWCFENKRAICGGFTSLGKLMYQMAGIPCFEVGGSAYDTALSHTWILVYYNGSWHYMDLTWDCPNAYFGEGKPNNILGQPAEYDYFGTPAHVFGGTHYSEGLSDTATHFNATVIKGIGISQKNLKTEYFLGEEFSKDYTLLFEYNKDGKLVRILTKTGLGNCSGYDMNKVGKQTVTVSFKGFTTSYDITVIDPAALGDFTVEKTKTSYKVGEILSTSDITASIIWSDGTKKTVTDFTVDTSKVNMGKAGTYTITVAYAGKTKNIPIVIKEKSITVKSLIVEKAKLTYEVGDVLNTDDLTVKAVYSDGTEEKITGYNVNTSSVNMNQSGPKSFTVSYGTYESTVYITVNPHVVSFDANGGDRVTMPQRTFSSHNSRFIVLPNAFYSGYKFLGWFTEKEGGDKVTIATQVTKSMTLYAQWESTLPSVKSAEVTLSGTKLTYTGKALKPAVKSVVLNGKTLTAETDYTVSYSNNKNIGTATVTITGIGKYAGAVEKTFSIVAKKGTIFTVGEYKYKITSSKEVAFAGIKSEKTTKVTIPKTVTIGGKSFKVTAIAKGALYNKKKVTSVVVGAYVKSVGQGAFKSCTGLKYITVKSEKIASVGKDAFKGIKSTAVIKVPSKKLDAYKKLMKGKGQGTSVKITK